MKLSSSLGSFITAVSFGMACLSLLVACNHSPIRTNTDATAANANVQGSSNATPTAAEIFGNPEYRAISYGGYREPTREDVPTVAQLKEDMRILAAMNVKVLRTYNTQQFAQAARLLEAIDELRAEDPDFEMYVMLGAWIDCEGAWGPAPNHEAESTENNAAEIGAAVALAQAHPETVKAIAVGNEAMVHWASSYFVRPAVILHWVEHLQSLKASGELSTDVWITSSDNFASWGGADAIYHTDDLAKLIAAVDFVSVHTYPFHDSHYNPAYWFAPEEEADASITVRADSAISRAAAYAAEQTQAVANHIASLGLDKPIHIGETGWSTVDSSLYGTEGSQATDEYKQKRYYDAMRAWTNEAGMSCFYFEAFDEQWKDATNPNGSENHFGLINLQGQAKYALWDLVDAGIFDGLTRGGHPITKTFGGDEAALLETLLRVPAEKDPNALTLQTINATREPGEAVSESRYIVLHDTLDPATTPDTTYPSAAVKLNVWEGTCGLEMSGDHAIRVTSGTGHWWGCALEIAGENLTPFNAGHLHFEIKGDHASAFDLGFQTGSFAAGTQTNNHVTFSPDGPYQLTAEWTAHSIPIATLNGNPDAGADLTDVTALLFFRGDGGEPVGTIEVRNVYYTRD